jgi:hypothetical protein
MGNFFLIPAALYCQGFGKIMVDVHLVRGRCHFLDFRFDFSALIEFFKL